MPGIEPGAFHMQSERSTAELHPPYLASVYGKPLPVRCAVLFSEAQKKKKFFFAIGTFSLLCTGNTLFVESCGASFGL